MYRSMSFLACLLLPVLLMSRPAAGQVGAEQKQAGPSAHELRREWVRRQLPKVVSDRAELAALNARLDDLNPYEINELATACLEALDAQRKVRAEALWESVRRAREAEEQRAAQEAELAAQAELQQPWGAFAPAFPYSPFAYYPAYVPFEPPILFFPTPAVGYYPVVAWLPQGVSMSASAVISPDMRHVRTSLNPFFSTIGPVDEFNYRTGETRRIERAPRRDRYYPRPRTYYDGLRTRTEPVPR